VDRQLASDLPKDLRFLGILLNLEIRFQTRKVVLRYNSVPRAVIVGLFFVMIGKFTGM